MYPNTDAALRQAYKIWAVRIEPMGNTAQVCGWLQSKGVKGGGSGLTQHEHHAESAMIIARVQRLLEPAELAVIEMHYTGGLKLDGIIDLTTHIERQNNGANLLLCDALIGNIFSGRPKRTAIQDRFDICKRTYFYKRRQIKQLIGDLFASAMCKLAGDFEQAGIIRPPHISQPNCNGLPLQIP